MEQKWSFPSTSSKLFDSSELVDGGKQKSGYPSFRDEG
jgi:hypothetical protein